MRIPFDALKPATPSGQAPVAGRRIVVPNATPSGTLFPLVTRRGPDARPIQWVVTLMPLCLPGSETTPWQGVVGTADWKAPIDSRHSQFVLQWGAGGVRMQSEFDWPASGQAFGIVADSIDILFRYRDLAGGANSVQSMAVAAYIEQGNPAQASPLRTFQSQAGPGTLYYAAAPFANRCVISTNTPGAAVSIAFSTLSGTSLMFASSVLTVPLELVVPAQTELLQVTTAAGQAITVNWLSSLNG